ncbi:flagellar hook-length control protein FliK [[Luteovulum] sphaeroides subsp. megalophilum]|nr:flagellar hook-length control protein FliK [[Luteovulum] sphaeroides subsp. megalophilum]
MAAAAAPADGAPPRAARRAGPLAEAGRADDASPVPASAHFAAGAQPGTAGREGAARAHPAAAGTVPAGEGAADTTPPSPAPAAQRTEAAAAPPATAGKAADASEAPAAENATAATVGQDGAETAPAVEPAGATLAGSDPVASAPLTAFPSDLRLERAGEPRAGAAGADGPLALAAPDAPAELQDRILEAAAGEGEIEIVLAPETLGRLRIRVEMRDGTAQVSFTTETAEAARLLSGQEGRLSDLLEKHGLSLGRHEAGQGDTGRRSEAPLPQPRPRALRPAPDPSEPAARAAAGTVNLIA